MNEPQHFVAEITQKAILEYQGKVLITSDDGELWELPGGRLHSGEKPVDGFRREMQEELAIQVEPLAVYDVDAFTSPAGHERFAVFYLCQPLTDVSKMKTSSEVVGMRWIMESEVDGLNMWPPYKEILHKFFHSRA